MDISFYTVESNFMRGKGYSEVCWGVVTTLQQLGHKVPFNSVQSPVQFNVCQPPYFADHLRSNQYNIGYVPWESTEVPEHWLDIIDELDELWTPSTWMANNYKDIKEINKPIYVYPHGIFPTWKPLKRLHNKTLRFLHQGEPRARVGGQQAYDAFKAAFGNSQDVELIIKAGEYSTIRDKSYGQISQPQGNVKVLNGRMEEKDLVGLYHRCHVMIGNSWGEGFGLTPFQAIGTGMPTIATKEWCEYSHYLQNLGIESEYIDSPWPEMHPGKMTKPIFDDLVDKLRFTYDNYGEISNKFYDQAFDFHEEYDWLKLTEKAFKHVVDMFEK